MSDPRDNPYRHLGVESFWRRSIALASVEGLTQPQGLFTQADRVVSAGSCFAANVIPYLETAGVHYVRTEALHPAFEHYPEHLGYGRFSAAYGNIYTVRQLVQLLLRALGRFMPTDDREHEDGLVTDLLRPGLRFKASSDGEFDALTRSHLDAVVEAIAEGTVFIFTLGLTEAWESRRDGAVYPVVPGSIAGRFDPQRFAFRNFAYPEVRRDLNDALALVREINPDIRLVVTVSPVPLVATASGQLVQTATTYSKSVMRAAAGDFTDEHERVEYFPAYEIITGPQAPESYFESDRRSVSEVGVEAVMSAMFGEMSGPGRLAESAGGEQAPAKPEDARLWLSQSIVDAECEEAMLDS
jgi:hypothetical protein